MPPTHRGARLTRSPLSFLLPGSGISPFMPIKTPSTTGSVLVRVFIFAARLFIFLPYVATYFLLLQHVPLHPALRKLLLWCILGIPGIWWVGLQLDGVQRGHLSQAPRTRVPHPGSVLAAAFTSPFGPRGAGPITTPTV